MENYNKRKPSDEQLLYEVGRVNAQHYVVKLKARQVLADCGIEVIC